MAMAFKYILDVAQGRPESCHETIYINLRTYKTCNLKNRRYIACDKIGVLAIDSEVNLEHSQHTYDR